MALCAGSCAAQEQPSPDLRQVLQRLERLEEQNRELMAEVRLLRKQLAAEREPDEPVPPTLKERLEIQESRTAEQAETKVEASHRLPLRITGMALFNAFLNSEGSGSQYPTVAAPAGGRGGGATFRQTVIGLDYRGPEALGGKISGSLRMDFFGGGRQLSQYLRVRTAIIAIDWRNRRIEAGVEKPLIAPREPDSLAQVGISPLSGAGNLWMWSPQFRFEQNISLGERTGFRAQMAAIQTQEVNASPASPYGSDEPAAETYVEPARPGIEGRLEFFAGTDRRLEIATGFHRSTTHAFHVSLPSVIYTVDWLATLWSSLDFTGTFFTGQNVAPLGTGEIRQGFLALGPGHARAVHSRGGWGQLAWRPHPRLWFNLFSGAQDDWDRDLTTGAIGRNLQFGANVFYRVAANMLASFEASQIRTTYIPSLTLRNNHYDLALAYLF